MDLLGDGANSSQSGGKLKKKKLQEEFNHLNRMVKHQQPVTQQEENQQMLICTKLDLTLPPLMHLGELFFKCLTPNSFRESLLGHTHQQHY